MTVKFRIYTKVKNADKKTRREGNKLDEYLMQKGFFKSRQADGSYKVVVYFREPLPMTNGKDSWFHYVAAVVFIPLMHEFGHRSVQLSSYCFDRAVFSAVMGKVRRRHQHYHE